MSLRQILCQFCLIGLLVAPAQAADHAVAFLYHRFGDLRYPSTSIATETFRSHLQTLQDGQYQVVTLGTLVGWLQAGEPLPEKTAVITVDDVYRSFLDAALPLLKSFNYPATLFVSTETIGGGDFLDWQELARLAAAGFEIGNHSARHDYLLDRLPGEGEEAWRQRIRRDLETAQRAFEDHLGFRPKLFAYPYGEFDPQLVELVREAGFTAAFGQQSGVIGAGQDLFTLPRFPMAGDYAETARFQAKLTMQPLPVVVLSPATNCLDKLENPPVLQAQVDLDGLAPDSLRCYVNGREQCDLVWTNAAEGTLEVHSTERLGGRRSKYTLTAHDGSGRQWFWFSQLWVAPRRQHPGD